MVADGDGVRAEGPPRSAAAKLTPEQQTLVVQNMGLAGILARRYTRRRPRDFPDVMADALLGLCRAARTFDPGRSSFSTYGYAGVRNYLHSRAARARAGRRGGGRGASRLDPRDMAEMFAAASADPAGSVEDRDRDAAVRDAVQRLHPRYRAVVEARMRGETLAEVAAALGITRERVRQLEEAAHAKLRAALRKGQLP